MANFNVTVNNPVSAGSGGTPPVPTPFTFPDLSSGTEVNTGWQYNGKDVFAIRYSLPTGIERTSGNHYNANLGSFSGVEDVIRFEGRLVANRGGAFYFIPIPSSYFTDTSATKYVRLNLSVIYTPAGSGSVILDVDSNEVSAFQEIYDHPLYADLYYTKL